MIIGVTCKWITCLITDMMDNVEFICSLKTLIEVVKLLACVNQSISRKNN